MYHPIGINSSHFFFFFLGGGGGGRWVVGVGDGGGRGLFYLHKRATTLVPIDSFLIRISTYHC